jgi:uncharacterized protein (DUF433 family)
MTDIVRTDGVMGGEPRLEGHRVSVLQVADMVLDADHSPEYVADQFGLTLAEVHRALSYYYEHPEEMESILERHAELEATLEERAVDPDRVEQ